jgi:pimeloyl-ACP methyl ester carboxylesterase
MKRIFCMIAMLVLLASSLHAQDISGDWQGRLGSGKGSLRLIVHIDKADDGGWKALLYSIDQTAEGVPLTSITQQSSSIAFSITELKVTYKGTIGSDGSSIVGSYTQGGTVPLTLVRPTKETAWPRDIHCACVASFVPVAPGVNLEVLDWGGTGRPLLLLAGLGYDAHDFDAFAAKLIGKYHVYGISRRGFGESSSPPPTVANYNADRLGDDVLAVIDALHLKQRPVLVGHSIAGEELSSIGSRYPDKVAGLVYLDAGYSYAFYDRAHGDYELDAVEAIKDLQNLVTEDSEEKKPLEEVLAKLPELEKVLREEQEAIAGFPPDDPSETASEFGPGEAIELGEQKYTEIKVPILAIFAVPHKFDPTPEYSAAERAAIGKYDLDTTTAQANAFEAGVPSAHVVRIANTDHFVYKSNEVDVLREMNAFLARLPN